MVKEKQDRCLKLLVMVLPGLHSGRYVWICLRQAGWDKSREVFWKFSEACSAPWYSAGVLPDSDLCWCSGLLFESLTPLATRDLTYPKSLIELYINSCSSLQHAPSTVILKKKFGKKRSNAWKERIRSIIRLPIGILEQDEFRWPRENYEDCKKTLQFWIAGFKINVSTLFLK